MCTCVHEEHKLSIRPAHKDYKLVYSKRALDSITYVTHPFGYADADAWQAKDTANLDALMDLPSYSEDEAN